MTKKVCVFVDGENFRHSIIDLFEQFEAHDYLPKANWDTLFDFFVEKAATDSERLRTYWYVIELLDFFPYRFPSVETDAVTLQQVLNKSKSCRRKLQHLQDNELTEEMKKIVEDLHARQNQMRRRFEGWRTLQDRISLQSSRIEFRRAGAITFNLFDNRLQKEKAVDVKLATDLIVLRDIYDVAVIVSGDQDYLPAVKTIKDFGKTVINVVFRTRSGRLLPGGARRLNELTDYNIEIRYGELAEYITVPGVSTPKLRYDSPSNR